jgi:hypothetical protein
MIRPRLTCVRPEYRPGCASISRSVRPPMIAATIPVMPHVRNPRMPRTRTVVALGNLSRLAHSLSVERLIYRLLLE